MPHRQGNLKQREILGATQRRGFQFEAVGVGKSNG